MWGWVGPCACPRRYTICSGIVTHTDHTRTRSGTRPPHPLHLSPCPYSTLNAFFSALQDLRVTIHTSHSVSERPFQEVSMQFGVYVPNFGPYGDARVLAE